jgi:hypothetical protein
MPLSANTEDCRAKCGFDYCRAHGCYYQLCGFITEPPRTRFCRKCGKQGDYVRTRYFEDGSSDVWECRTEGCEIRGLIWHTDTPRGERSPVVDKVLNT